MSSTVKCMPWIAGCMISLAACDPGFSIEGRVTGCKSHDPIIGVLVEMFFGKRAKEGRSSYVDYTDPEGEFDVGAMGFGDNALTLRLTKPGHVTKEVHLSKAPEHHVEYCLEADESDEAAGPGGPDEDAGYADGSEAEP